ncbi:unnamed protein product, partial [Ectocarpus fasciculatus]
PLLLVFGAGAASRQEHAYGVSCSLRLRALLQLLLLARLLRGRPPDDNLGGPLDRAQGYAPDLGPSPAAAAAATATRPSVTGLDPGHRRLRCRRRSALARELPLPRFLTGSGAAPLPSAPSPGA